MKLTILTENTANKRGFLAEHGLSVLVEARGRKLLFDTGQSGVYLHNAAAAGVSLKGLDGIVLSHGHYDHTGGLELFPKDERIPVFVRECVLREIFQRENGPERYWNSLGKGSGGACVSLYGRKGGIVRPYLRSGRDKVRCSAGARTDTVFCPKGRG